MRIAIMAALAVAGLAAEAAAACRDCPELVPIPMADGAALAMTVTEITFEHWAACVKDRACKGGQDDHGWGRGRRPVINVSWDDVNAYARWLSAKLGRACRLPTEAEWEFAARGGSPTPYWWGGEHGTGMANCRDCNPAPIYGTTPAGAFPPNPYGLRDMNGNVWEWVQDCWQLPVPDKGCSQRVIKGGSWYYYSRNSTVTARAQNVSTTGSYNVGFRLVCTP